MSADTFTPGPWKWWTSNSMRRLSSVPSGKDGDVLYAFIANDGVPDIHVRGDDAALIEAAPDLLKALHGSWQLMKEACAELSDCGAPESLINSLNDEIGRSYAALKKAGAL
jgi:hypothetical protein